jgi:hypothetical protein
MILQPSCKNPQVFNKCNSSQRFFKNGSSSGLPMPQKSPRGKGILTPEIVQRIGQRDTLELLYRGRPSMFIFMSRISLEKGIANNL